MQRTSREIQHEGGTTPPSEIGDLDRYELADGVNVCSSPADHRTLEQRESWRAAVRAQLRSVWNRED